MDDGLRSEIHPLFGRAASLGISLLAAAVIALVFFLFIDPYLINEKEEIEHSTQIIEPQPNQITLDFAEEVKVIFREAVDSYSEELRPDLSGYFEIEIPAVNDPRFSGPLVRPSVTKVYHSFFETLLQSAEGIADALWNQGTGYDLIVEAAKDLAELDDKESVEARRISSDLQRLMRMRVVELQQIGSNQLATYLEKELVDFEIALQEILGTSTDESQPTSGRIGSILWIIVFSFVAFNMLLSNMLLGNMLSKSKCPSCQAKLRIYSKNQFSCKGCHAKLKRSEDGKFLLLEEDS